MARLIWLVIGFISLGLGFAGILLPLLPTTPFVLLAAYAFARSSPSLHDWLLSHPRFGLLIFNWNRYGAIPRGAKYWATVVVAATWGLSFVFGVKSLILIIQSVILSAVLIFLWTRPLPPKPDGDS